MICPKCENKISAKPKKEPVNYSPMFLHNEVVIENAKAYHCDKCLFNFHDLGDSDQIDLQIACQIVDQGEVKRSQIAWVRRSLLKMSIAELSYHLGFNARFLIDLECFKAILSKDKSEILCRLVEKHIASRRLLITKKAQKIKLQLF